MSPEFKRETCKLRTKTERVQMVAEPETHWDHLGHGWREEPVLSMGVPEFPGSGGWDRTKERLEKEWPAGRGGENKGNGCFGSHIKKWKIKTVPKSREQSQVSNAAERSRKVILATEDAGDKDCGGGRDWGSQCKWHAEDPIVSGQCESPSCF